MRTFSEADQHSPTKWETVSGQLGLSHVHAYLFFRPGKLATFPTKLPIERCADIS
jgi:hypothetical protein